MGSAPGVTACRDWPRTLFSSIVAINNAWRVRDDWDYHVAPDDFPKDRSPDGLRGDQRQIGSDSYVPTNNQYGGIIYAGGTMAFSAGYWALSALRPEILVFAGCDMVYPASGNTHFYGTGTPDPLRVDITLRNLEAKSARLMFHAARQGCACVRIPSDESRLVFPVAELGDLARGQVEHVLPDLSGFMRVKARERELGCYVESGRYWEAAKPYPVSDLDDIDRMWLGLCGLNLGREHVLLA
ncbi:hypothetical protein [Primorskyibacter sp. 2E233]|uniref:hypothetical protein n=1 Tax=Primorskyibacter sp. 2E233 TaxID=3413431 RepID=UPI003BF07B51